MTIPRALRSYLKDHDIKYQAIDHTSAYTAQQLAHAQHVSGEQVVKVVLLRSEGGFLAAALPASYRVDFSKLKALSGKSELRLGTEAEIRKLFPDCEVGAIPPFTEIYHLPLYMDGSLKGRGEVLVVAGTHRDAIRMTYEDFEKWAKPIKIGSIGAHLA